MSYLSPTNPLFPLIILSYLPSTLYYLSLLLLFCIPSNFPRLRFLRKSFCQTLQARLANILHDGLCSNLKFQNNILSLFFPSASKVCPKVSSMTITLLTFFAPWPVIMTPYPLPCPEHVLGLIGLHPTLPPVSSSALADPILPLLNILDAQEKPLDLWHEAISCFEVHTRVYLAAPYWMHTLMYLATPHFTFRPIIRAQLSWRMGSVLGRNQAASVSKVSLQRFVSSLLRPLKCAVNTYV